MLTGVERAAEDGDFVSIDLEAKLERRGARGRDDVRHVLRGRHRPAHGGPGRRRPRPVRRRVEGLRDGAALRPQHRRDRRGHRHRPLGEDQGTARARRRLRLDRERVRHPRGAPGRRPHPAGPHEDPAAGRAGPRQAGRAPARDRRGPGAGEPGRARDRVAQPGLRAGAAAGRHGLGHVPVDLQQRLPRDLRRRAAQERRGGRAHAVHPRRDRRRPGDHRRQRRPVGADHGPGPAQPDEPRAVRPAAPAGRQHRRVRGRRPPHQGPRPAARADDDHRRVGQRRRPRGAAAPDRPGTGCDGGRRGRRGRARGRQPRPTPRTPPRPDLPAARRRRRPTPLGVGRRRRSRAVRCAVGEHPPRKDCGVRRPR